MQSTRLLTSCGLLLCSLHLVPCIWDSDTIADELRGVPEARQLVTGRWYRHGPAYYQARVDRLAAAAQLSLAQLDDLAVAYEKLGRGEEAVAVMARKRAALDAAPDPEHEYRYLANLGTFHAHLGEYGQAIELLEKAVALNPRAHFGRERLQIEILRWVQAAKREPQRWRQGVLSGSRPVSFGLVMVYGDAWSPRDGEHRDNDADLKALAGMLRFGGREGAELYRLLADVFLRRTDLNLAWWCLQHAIAKGHPAAEHLRQAVGRIEAHWREAARYTAEDNPVPTLADFAAVRSNGRSWLAAFQRLEAEALGRGEDPGQTETLARLIRAADAEVPPPVLFRAWWAWARNPVVYLIGVPALVILCTLLRRVWRRRRDAPSCPAP